MTVEVNVGKKTYQGTKQKHAEEVMFSSENQAGNMQVSMNAWPCTGPGRHDCHKLFIQKSKNRVITVTITGDQGGYSADHGRQANPTGTITYDNGQVSYT